MTNYNAVDYQRRHDRSVALTAGKLRQSLDHNPPAQELIGAIRRNRETSRGWLVAVDQRAHTGERAVVIVVISEQLGANGKLDSVPHATVSEATLERRRDRWRITGWTQLP